MFKTRVGTGNPPPYRVPDPLETHKGHLRSGGFLFRSTKNRRGRFLDGSSEDVGDTEDGSNGVDGPREQYLDSADETS